MRKEWTRIALNFDLDDEADRLIYEGLQEAVAASAFKSPNEFLKLLIEVSLPTFEDDPAFNKEAAKRFRAQILAGHQLAPPPPPAPASAPPPPAPPAQPPDWSY